MRLYFYDENSEERQKVIRYIKDILEGKEIVKELISNNITKYTTGHFFRKV